MLHVVIAVGDDREQARELTVTVERLATEAEIKITLVHVFRDPEVPAQVSFHQSYEDYEELIEEARDLPVSVHESIERIKELDTDFNVEIKTGDPGEQIVQLAEEFNTDAIYIGGRKSSPVGKLVFGSVTQNVIFNTDIPITICGSPD